MKKERICAFCGSTGAKRTQLGLLAAIVDLEGVGVCPTCIRSIDGRMPGEWFRWLKTNDPEHWQRLVDHHRLGSNTIADQIRRLRIEQ